jgi:coproporphyrinogen III oxidase
MDFEFIKQDFKLLQSVIVNRLKQCDESATIINTPWKKDNNGEHFGYGGGGISILLKEGSVFEQAGINFSAVSGILDKSMSLKLTGKELELPFNATGVSLVIHPYSPHLPTTHANVRFLKVGEYTWFGGGCDLTPYLFYQSDAEHFHSVLQSCCNNFNKNFYLDFKQECDTYFYLPHRQETRGIGGIFFDYLGRDNNSSANYYEFTNKVGACFTDAYIPIIESRKHLTYNELQRDYQLWRRGRYVEFNLLYDRGTLFGLKTGGRIASILMSLPPIVKWNEEIDINDFNCKELVETTFKEKPWHYNDYLKVLKNPRNWVN